MVPTFSCLLLGSVLLTLPSRGSQKSGRDSEPCLKISTDSSSFSCPAYLLKIEFFQCECRMYSIPTTWFSTGSRQQGYMLNICKALIIYPGMKKMCQTATGNTTKTMLRRKLFIFGPLSLVPLIFYFLVSVSLNFF